MQQDARVELRNVCQYFVTKTGVVQALGGLSFTLQDGEFVSLVGPSGCGKSTCLGLISGLSSPTSGELLVDHVPVVGPNRHVGYMLQKDLPMPWRSILDNVSYGLQIRRVPRKEATARALAGLRRCSGHIMTR